MSDAPPSTARLNDANSLQPLHTHEGFSSDPRLDPTRWMRQHRQKYTRSASGSAYREKRRGLAVKSSQRILVQKWVN